MSNVLSALTQFVDQHPISAYLLVLIAAISGAVVGAGVSLWAVYMVLDFIIPGPSPCIGGCGYVPPML